MNIHRKVGLIHWERESELGFFRQRDRGPSLTAPCPSGGYSRSTSILMLSVPWASNSHIYRSIRSMTSS